MAIPLLERPVLAVDVVIFRVADGQLAVFLHPRAEDPFRGAFALPGVAVQVEETLETAARRALLEKSGYPAGTWDEIYLEQLATFGALYRDPRGRTVSVAYLGVIRGKAPLSGPSRWFPVSGIAGGGLPFDHQAILDTALARLRGKARYTNIVRHLLPPAFRIEELQAVYEAILGWPLNRTNFRSRMLQRELIQRVRILSEAVGRRGGRPPHLYRFSQDRVEAEARDFL